MPKVKNFRHFGMWAGLGQKKTGLLRSPEAVISRTHQAGEMIVTHCSEGRNVAFGFYITLHVYQS